MTAGIDGVAAGISGVAAGEEYPRFTDGEMQRRRQVLEAAMAEHELRCLVVYGERGSTAIPWVTGWHVTRQAVAIVVPGEHVELRVQLYNHVPNARRLATHADVRWAGPDTVQGLAEAVAARVSRADRVGWIGPLAQRAHAGLAAVSGGVVDLSATYDRFRMVKSPEELVWMRVGAHLTDLSLEALLEAAVPGVSEAELAAAVECAYLGHGGTNHLHFFAATPMDDPRLCVPAQWPSRRTLRAGDVVVTELSASYWSYPGQLLRTIAIASEPTPRYRQLHDVAEEAFREVARRIRAGAHAAELVQAADVIEAAGCSIYDDLLHGFGGGYLQPVLRTRATALEDVPDLRLEAGMTIVLQPNVITPDGRAGVQTGELLLVTETGYERLHAAPRGFLSAP